MNSALKAVFLDRDGVINEKAPEGFYIASADEFVLLPGAAAAIALLSTSGFLVFVATNQRCIGKGIVSAEDLGRIHERLHLAVMDAGGTIERIYVCPHDYSDACECRKPKPGMLHQAAKDYSLSLGNCWMIGDTVSDVIAGREAGCHTVLVGNKCCGQADLTACDLSDAVDKILAVASSSVFRG